jgi:putative alpha-1,2-mannosidase
MAKPVADSSTAWQNQAGFLHDNSKIKGFSQMHDEGTGGQPSLGNFPISMGNCNGSDWDSCPTTSIFRSADRVGEPRAEVGSFSIRIDTGYDIGISYSSVLILTADMTSTRRTNLFRITAVDYTDVPVLSVGLFDLSESTLGVFAEVRSDSRVIGNGTFKPSFGEGIRAMCFDDT